MSENKKVFFLFVERHSIALFVIILSQTNIFLYFWFSSIYEFRVEYEIIKSVVRRKFSIRYSIFKYVLVFFFIETPKLFAFIENFYLPLVIRAFSSSKTCLSSISASRFSQRHCSQQRNSHVLHAVVGWHPILSTLSYCSRISSPHSRAVFEFAHPPQFQL